MNIVKWTPLLPTINGDSTITERLKYPASLRYEVFSHYCGGGAPRCQCKGCTVTFIGFLELDHINGDGAKHRKDNNLGTGGPRLWSDCRKKGYPEGFQVLCSNCNGSKGTGKTCALYGQAHCEAQS
jgi:hypothetical protein